MHMRRGIAPLSALLAGATIAACGSSGSSHSTIASGGASGSQNGEASKPASQILADAVSALSRVTSFHIQGNAPLTASASEIFSGDFELPGRLHMTITVGDQQAGVIEFYGTTYLMGNAAFLRAHIANQAAVNAFANHWIVAPASAAGLGLFVALANPATLGHCMLQLHLGTVTVAGTTSYQGQPVVALQAHDDVPGSSAGKLYIASTGPPLPLGVVQAGNTRPGGSPDRTCGETTAPESTPGTGNLTISRYNQSVNITAPSSSFNFTGH